MDYSTYFRFVIALVFVLALIGVLAWAARHFGLLRGALRPRNGERRLEVLEIAPIDSKRRLLLLRCDRTEHLVLLGPTTDVVIESGVAARAAPPVPAGTEP